MTINSYLASVISVMLGAVVTYFIAFGDRRRRGRGVSVALRSELLAVSNDIQEKIVWLKRDVKAFDLKEPDSDRIVVRDGKLLYLGEREEFTVARPYWLLKYTDAAELIDPEQFSSFYQMYRLVDKFEQRFKELKHTFDLPALGSKKDMAIWILEDLTRINADLRSRLGIQDSQIKSARDRDASRSATTSV